MKAVLEIFSRLIGRLSVSKKLILIYLLDLTAVIFITSILIEEKFIAINFARKEINGNASISVVRDVLFDGIISTGRQKTHEIEPVIKRFEEMESGAGKGLANPLVVQNFRDNLKLLRHQKEPSGTEAVTQKLLTSGRTLISQIGDQSNLILDPDLDSYYTMSLVILRFPALMELLARLPETGSNTLMLEAQLEALLASIESDYRSAYAGNPDKTLATQLQASQTRLLSELRVLLEDIRRTRAVSTALRQQTLEATRFAWQEAGSSLHKLLASRVDQLYWRMWMHLGMAAVLLIIILFLVFYISRQISLPLRRLADVAKEVQTSNDYSLRAFWKSDDEIGHLVVGFNTMLDRLDRERLVQQQLAAQAGAARAQKELLEAIPIPLLVTAIPDHQILHANAPAAAWANTGSHNPWSNGLTSSDRARFFQRIADEGAVHEFEACWHGTKRDSWALISASRLNYQGQDSVLATFSPISEIKRLEARLKIWGSVFEASSEGILVFDRDHRVMLANAAITRTTGYRVEELIGNETEFLSSPTQNEGTIRMIQHAFRDHRAWQGEFWLRRKNGEEVPQWLAINTVRDERGEPTHAIAIFVDISERKANEEKIRHLAHHDPLTGLPNRILFDERLRMSLQQSERNSQRGALLFIDLDRFKSINDSLGHNVGDALLQSVSARLAESVRAGDTVCRQGGDEFVVILNGITDVQEVAHIVEGRLINRILATHSVCGIEVHISCSVGIAIFPDDGNSIETLMRNADAAMYAAKANGRNNFQFFSDEMNRHAVERLTIENNLHEAIRDNQFELHLQPIISADNGELRSVEALIRWRHPAMGMLPPATFIPIAEQTGQIVAIGAWVIEEACRMHTRWIASGLGAIPVAVNVSAIQFQRGGFVDSVVSSIRNHGMNPKFLQLELTETLVMTSSQSTLEELGRLKEMGISLSLDDFGTGYSSLSYLSRFPFDKLKIDRSFVHDMIEDPADLVITRTIIALGNALGLLVVAEGVEHSDELHLLRHEGCEEVQGYLISEPLPDWEFERWLHEWREGRCSEVIGQQ